MKGLTRGWKKEPVEILNDIMENTKLPQGWELARIFPIYKTGEEDEMENYRGISLLDVRYKLLTNIVATRNENLVGENE